MCVTHFITYPCCGGIAFQHVEPCTTRLNNPSHVCPPTAAFDSTTLPDTAACLDCQLSQREQEEARRRYRIGKRRDEGRDGKSGDGK
jgi:hypothetical protein